MRLVRKIKLCSIIFSTFFANNIWSQNSLITADILRQTYYFEFNDNSGTCFLVEFNNKEFLITAKHVFKNNISSGEIIEIKILIESHFKNIKLKYFDHIDTTVDLAVLELKESLKVIKPYDIEGTCVVGQDIYFLGYPIIDNNLFKTQRLNGQILPLVKKGILSGINSLNNHPIYFLDGHNIPGFSGGPVIAYDLILKKNIIIGIISGYYFDTKPIKDSTKKEMGSFIEENTGIILCYPIALAIEIISKIK